jgi:hypothetical protein
MNAIVADDRSLRSSPLVAALIAAHALALALFVFEPKYGLALLLVVLGAVAGFAAPKTLAFCALGLLWVNDVISDWAPFSRLTAWKDALLLLACVIAVATAVIRRREMIPSRRVATPLLLVVLLYLLMCAYSPSASQALLGLKNTVFYALWFFVLPLIITNKRDARTLVIALFVSMVALGLYNLWRVQLPWGAFPPRRDGKILGGWSQVHWSGSPYLIAPGLVLGLALLPEFRGWRRWAMMASLTIGTAGLLTAGARATTGSVILGMMAVGVLGGHVVRTLKLVAVGVVAAVALQSVIPVNISERATSAFDTQDVSRKAREEETAAVTVPYVLTHPFGSGTGTMSALYSSGGVWNTGSLDFALQGGTIHNTFLMIAIEVGWLGAILWAVFLYGCGTEAYRWFRGTRDPFVSALALGLLGVVIQYSFLHFFAPMLSAALISYAIWPVLGLIAALPALDSEGGTAQAAPVGEVGVECPA